MRRRFILFIFIAILTFAIGVSVDRLFYRFVPTKVSLCQLVRHPERYDGKLVRVEAPAMASFGVATIFDDSCKDGGVAARVMRNESFQSSAEIKSFFAESTDIHAAKVLVTGRFAQGATMGRYGPRFVIHASSIELRSPVITKPTFER